MKLVRAAQSSQKQDLRYHPLSPSRQCGCARSAPYLILFLIVFETTISERSWEGKIAEASSQAPCNILKDESEPGKEKVNDEKTWTVCGIVGDTS